MKQLKMTFAFLIVTFVAGAAYMYAQDAAEDVKAQKRMMEETGVSPGDVFQEMGQDYFNSAEGPNGKTCASCHGQDGEELEGAFRKMPRYYKDKDMVMDIDYRIKTCMEDNMGFEKVDRKKKQKNDMINVALFVASKSNDEKIRSPKRFWNNKKDREVYARGKELWYMRIGKMDFSCAMCHDLYGGQRIRLQNLARVKPDKTATHWPAYRFGKGALWTLEDRVRGCYKAMRMPKPPYFAPEQIALIKYMRAETNGAKIAVPGLVR